MLIIDNGAGLELYEDDDDFFVQLEDNPDFCASLLCAQHEHELSDGVTTLDLSRRQIRQVEDWAYEHFT